MEPLGSFLAPYMIKLGATWFSYAVCGTTALFAVLLSLLLSETKGMTMPETLAELKQQLKTK